MGIEGGQEQSYPSDDLDVGGSRSIAGSNSVHDHQDILLHHSDKIQVIFSLGHVAEMLDEVHDIRPVVHRVLS